MIAGSGELDKAGAITQCFFDISLKLNDMNKIKAIENTMERKRVRFMVKSRHLDSILEGNYAYI